MTDNELKLNASGYKDEPCYKTIKTLDGPKPGEIWENWKTKKLALVLANMNNVCTILNLVDQENKNRIKVTASVPMYTAPNMVSWCFSSDLNNYVKAITDEEYLEVKKAVAEALGLLCIILDAREDTRVKALEEERDKMFTALGHANKELIKMTDERDTAESERDAALNVADQIHAENIDASIQLEKEKAKSQFYREMYETLLDKLISAKGVSANE